MRLFLWWLLSLCFSTLKKFNLVLPFTIPKKKGRKRRKRRGEGGRKRRERGGGGGEEEKEEVPKIANG